MQMIFQDPISSLNPRRKVGDIVAEGLDIWEIGDKASRKDEGRRRCSRPSGSIPRPRAGAGRTSSPAASASASRSPRAIITEPKLIICDEPVSALDVSVQAQILNLLEDMKARYQLTMVFIAHDLAVVKNVSDRVAVMYLGKFCEVGAARRSLRRVPRTRTPPRCSRRSPSPIPTPRRRPRTTTSDVLGGEIPSPTDPPSGCRFRTRCPQAEERARRRSRSSVRSPTRPPSAASTWPATSRSKPGEQLEFRPERLTGDWPSRRRLDANVVDRRL